MTEIILNGVSTEQLVNLIDERTQKALEKLKNELNSQQSENKLFKKKNSCDFLRVVLYILQYIMLALQVLHLLG